MVIVGEPGSGKSTFMAYLAVTWNCPIHFIRVDNIGGVIGVDPRSFLISIGSQLYQKYGPDIFPKGVSGTTKVTSGFTKDNAEVVGRFIDELYTLPFLLPTQRDVTVKAGIATGESKVIGERIRKMVDVTHALDEKTLLHVAVLNPVQKIEELYPDERVVILIDALDESLQHSGTQIVDIIPRVADSHFSDNLRLVMATRPGDHLVSFREKDLLLLDDEKYRAKVRKDTRVFIDKHLAEKPLSTAMRALSTEEREAYLEEIQTNSDGNFLYLYYFIGELTTAAESGETALRQISVPKGLDDIYRVFAVDKMRDHLSDSFMFTVIGEISGDVIVQWESMPGVKQVRISGQHVTITMKDVNQIIGPLYSLAPTLGIHIVNPQVQQGASGGAWEEKYLPVLGVLAVAYDFLYREQLAGFAGVEVEYVDTILAQLKQFLDIESDENKNRYRLYHYSFAEYLLDGSRNREYPLDGPKCHDQVASYYKGNNDKWSEVDRDQVDEYGLQHLVKHLVDVVQDEPSRRDELHSIVCRSLMLAKNARAGGTYQTFTQDVDLVIDVLECGTKIDWPELIRLSLLSGTLRSMSARVDPVQIGMLASLGRTDEAFGFTALTPNLFQRCWAYFEIVQALIEQGAYESALKTMDYALETSVLPGGGPGYAIIWVDRTLVRIVETIEVQLSDGHASAYIDDFIDRLFQALSWFDNVDNNYKRLLEGTKLAALLALLRLVQSTEKTDAVFRGFEIAKSLSRDDTKVDAVAAFLPAFERMEITQPLDDMRLIAYTIEDVEQRAITLNAIARAAARQGSVDLLRRWGEKTSEENVEFLLLAQLLVYVLSGQANQVLQNLAQLEPETPAFNQCVIHVLSLQALSFHPTNSAMQHIGADTFAIASSIEEPTTRAIALAVTLAQFAELGIEFSDKDCLTAIEASRELPVGPVQSQSLSRLIDAAVKSQNPDILCRVLAVVEGIEREDYRQGPLEHAGNVLSTMRFWDGLEPYLDAIQASVSARNQARLLLQLLQQLPPAPANDYIAGTYVIEIGRRLTAVATSLNKDETSAEGARLLFDKRLDTMLEQTTRSLVDHTFRLVGGQRRYRRTEATAVRALTRIDPFRAERYVNQCLHDLEADAIQLTSPSQVKALCRLALHNASGGNPSKSKGILTELGKRIDRSGELQLTEGDIRRGRTPAWYASSQLEIFAVALAKVGLIDEAVKRANTIFSESAQLENLRTIARIAAERGLSQPSADIAETIIDRDPTSEDSVRLCIDIGYVDGLYRIWHIFQERISDPNYSDVFNELMRVLPPLTDGFHRLGQADDALGVFQYFMEQWPYVGGNGPTMLLQTAANTRRKAALDRAYSQLVDSIIWKTMDSDNERAALLERVADGMAQIHDVRGLEQLFEQAIPLESYNPDPLSFIVEAMARCGYRDGLMAAFNQVRSTWHIHSHEVLPTLAKAMGIVGDVAGLEALFDYGKDDRTSDLDATKLFRALPMAFIENGEPEHAVEAACQGVLAAKSWNKIIDDPSCIAIAYGILAEVYFEIGDLHLASDSASKAYAAIRSIDRESDTYDYRTKTALAVLIPHYAKTQQQSGLDDALDVTFRMQNSVLFEDLFRQVVVAMADIGHRGGLDHAAQKLEWILDDMSFSRRKSTEALGILAQAMVKAECADALRHMLPRCEELSGIVSSVYENGSQGLSLLVLVAALKRARFQGRDEVFKTIEICTPLLAAANGPDTFEAVYRSMMEVDSWWRAV